MSSFSEQDPLNPNDPEFYAPPRLRERAAKLGRSLSQEARLDPIRSSPISLPRSTSSPRIRFPMRRGTRSTPR